MAINNVTLSGNLTRDPELRTTQNGNGVLKFGIAVNERRLNNGQWEDYANFFDCTIFGKRADGIAKHLSKGSKVTVTGRLHQSRWENNGEKRSRIEVYVDDIDFMPRPKQEDTLLDIDYAF